MSGFVQDFYWKATSSLKIELPLDLPHPNRPKLDRLVVPEEADVARAALQSRMPARMASALRDLIRYDKGGEIEQAVRVYRELRAVTDNPPSEP